MNIQDPFVLDHNVAQNLNETIRDLMIKEFSIAAYKAERWQAIEFATTKCLLDILDDRIPEGFDEELALASIPGMKLGEYQFVVELKSPTLSPQLLRTLEAEGDLYKAWSKKMIHFIYDVIERIIMFDSEVISTNMPEPVKKSRKYNHKEKSDRSLRESLKTPIIVDEEEENGEGEITVNVETSEDVEVKEVKVTIPEVVEEEVDLTKDPRRELYLDADYYIDMNSFIMCRVWAERKKLGNMLKERGFTESIELEQSISERLYYDNHYEKKPSIMEMRIIMKSVILNNRAEIMVDVSGPPGQGEFHCVYHYLKKFVIKMADKFFDIEIPGLL